MEIKIAICDDNQTLCIDLENTLKQIAILKSYDFKIKLFFSGETLYKYLRNKDDDFDIIFLDIEFNENMSGIDIGNIIRNHLFKETIKIVYISNFEKYALDLFKFRPFDFIVKPFTFKKIEETIESIIKIMTKQKNPFEYKVRGEIYRIDLYKILYFVSDMRKLEIVTINEHQPHDKFYGKISEIAMKLVKSDFFFIQKSYLINYHNVSEFEYKKVKMINGDVLNISQNYRKPVREIRNKKIGE